MNLLDGCLKIHVLHNFYWKMKIRQVWKKLFFLFVFLCVVADIMVVYPGPLAGRASYCGARRRWIETASTLGIGPHRAMLTVGAEGNLLLLQHFGGWGQNNLQNHISVGTAPS